MLLFYTLIFISNPILNYYWVVFILFVIKKVLELNRIAFARLTNIFVYKVDIHIELTVLDTDLHSVNEMALVIMRLHA